MARSFAWVRENVTDPNERQLERAKALSHASLFSHERRKNRKKAVENSNSEAEVKSLQVVPAPVVWKGNSDPFRTTKVDISPRMNQAFQFLCDALIPATHWNDGQPGTWTRNFLPDRTVRKHVESMSDEWSALGEMLPLGAAIARLSQSSELQRHTLMSKMKVIRRLSAYIPRADDAAARDHIIALTRTLFATATFENNHDEARLHGVALRNLLYDKTRMQGVDAIDINLVWSSVFYDAQLAHTTMGSSIFDVDEWANTCLMRAAGPVYKYLEPLHELYSRALDPSLDSSPLLKKICVDIYEVVYLWGQTKPLNDEMSGTMMNVYATGKHNIFQLQLSNHLIHVRRMIDELEAGDRLVVQLCPHTEAALTVALIAYLASFVGNPRVGGQYMWPRVPLLLTQLYHHLSRSSRDLTAPVRILLFAYWVGATWERNANLTMIGTPLAWFTTGFVKLCNQLGFADWRSAQTALDRFVPTHLAKPSGASWVDEALQKPAAQSAAQSMNSS